MGVIRETVESVRIETADQARARFWQVYLSLGGRDSVWFEAHVDAVVRAVLQLPPAEQPRLNRRELLPWGRSVEVEALIA